MKKALKKPDNRGRGRTHRSSFGGSCQYKVSVETDHGDEDADGDIFKKYVCMGKELENIEGSSPTNNYSSA